MKMRKSVVHHPLRSRRPTIAIAHRGGAKLAPENSLPAFRSALTQWRCEMLEVDVRFTADGVPVIWHDPTVERLTEASGAVQRFSLAELKRLDAGYRFSPDGVTHPFRARGITAVTLEELLSISPEALLNIELKPEAAAHAPAFAEALEPHLHRVCVGSESDALAETLVGLLPGACHFYPREALTRLVIALKQGESPPPDAGYEVLDMPLYFEGIRLIDEAFLRAAEAAGKWVNVWTVDDPAEMRQLVSEGVGGVMTDRPDLLRAVLDEAR